MTTRARRRELARESKRGMTETEIARFDTLATCKLEGHIPGSEVVVSGIGATSYGGEEYWAALRDGANVRATCSRCGAPLSVSLRVRVPRR
jgi:hypothetical protein